MVDVFISYKRAERDAVMIIADRLMALNLDVWFDAKLRAGGTFDEEIATAIREAKAVLVCWTPAALESEWVRGEATMAFESQRLVACFLEPTKLIPPFNLIHGEDLAAWAGQDDDPAWIKVLERIGQLVDRPGLSTYHSVVRPGATEQELHSWASENGADPLTAGVWARLEMLSHEDSRTRLEREQREALERDKQRKAQNARSRQLMRERGLRDPKRERQRFLALTATVVLVGLFAAGGITYVLDSQARDTKLRKAETLPEVRSFLGANKWHPIATEARDKLRLLDNDAWRDASLKGTIEAYRQYVDDAKQEPPGQFINQAERALRQAEQVKAVQEQLSRMRFYDGKAHGGLDETTRAAIKRFRFRWGMPVNESIDDGFLRRLDEALEIYAHPQLSELRAQRTEPPTEADLIHIAETLNVDMPAIGAVIDVDSGLKTPGFLPDGRPLIFFNPSVFSRNTKRTYDEKYPDISMTRPDITKMPPDRSAHWVLLEKAFSLDPEAALKATSWGKIQMLGEGYKNLGFKSVGEFVRFVSESEANQLEAALFGIVKQRNLDEHLRNRDWEKFARGFNGPGFRFNHYDEKLAKAFQKRVALSERGEAQLVTTDLATAKPNPSPRR